MNNPFPAETPDPNIDNPAIPPSEPQPEPEQDPPGTTPPPPGRTAKDDAAGDCESAMKTVDRSCRKAKQCAGVLLAYGP